MDPGEQTTGTRDEHYNLISVLYHALHGAENCEVYIADAEAAGQDDLAAFFREAQAMQAALAERAKGHLGIGGTTPADITEGVTAGAGVPMGSTPPRTARSGWETPPPRPRRASPAEAAPPGEGVTERGTVPPDAPRTQDPPPRVGDAPPSPSEQP